LPLKLTHYLRWIDLLTRCISSDISNIFNQTRESVESLVYPEAVKSLRKTRMRYRGFPSFGEWKTYAVDTKRWNQCKAGIKELEISDDILRRARAVIQDAVSAPLCNPKRAVKRKPELPLFKATCKALMREQGLVSLPYLESQLAIYDHVMDFAVKNKKISQSWILKLQLLLSRPTTRSRSPSGDRPDERVIRPGRYKRSPNHLPRKNGETLVTAPVKRTPSEMRKYCAELRSKAFLDAHPILQASYAHYALVLIHPFVDGNGRIARLLALAFVYRTNLIPRLSLNKHRRKYLLALRAADAGEFQPFINLVQESAIEASSITKRSILSAMKQAQITRHGTLT